jgi:hypothetical protein
MPKVSWGEMMREHPAAHLVVGVISEGNATVSKADYSGAKIQLQLLARLAKALPLRHKYALSINRERDGSQIFVALVDPDDASKLAGLVRARDIGRYSGWRSQRSFRFDRKTETTITAALCQADPKRRQHVLPEA